MVRGGCHIARGAEAPTKAVIFGDGVQKAGGMAEESRGLAGPAAGPLATQAAPARLPSCFEASLKENFQLVHLGSVLLGGSSGGFSFSQFTQFGARSVCSGLWVIFSCEDKKGVGGGGLFLKNFK